MQAWQAAATTAVAAGVVLIGQPAVAQGLAPVGGGGPSASAYELTFWQSVAASDDQAQLEAYLSAYPNGAFSTLARLKIAALRQRLSGNAAPVPVVPPAPVVAPEPPPVVAPAPTPVVAPPPVAAPAVVAAAPAVVAAPPGPVADAVIPAASVAVPAPRVATVAQALPAPPTPAPVQPVAPVSLAEQLRLLASGQGGTNPGAAAVRAGIVLPVPPVQEKVPELALPDHFCSAQDRNLFYDARYKPAIDLADRNNQAAIGHLKDLQRLYDERGRAGDIAGQNQLAAAARDYDPVAAEAFRARSAYDAAFTRMMAVPIRDCAPGES